METNQTMDRFNPFWYFELKTIVWLTLSQRAFYLWLASQSVGNWINKNNALAEYERVYFRINTYGKCVCACMCVCEWKGCRLHTVKYRYSPINGKLISLEHMLTVSDLHHQLIGIGRLLLLQDWSQVCVHVRVCLSFQVEKLTKTPAPASCANRLT